MGACWRLSLLLKLVSGSPNRVTGLAVRFEFEISIKVLHGRLVVLLKYVNVGQHQVDLGILWCQIAGSQSIGFRLGCLLQSHLRASQLKKTVPAGTV